MKHLILKNIIYFRLHLLTGHLVLFCSTVDWALSLFYKFNCWANIYFEEGKDMHRPINVINIERSIIYLNNVAGNIPPSFLTIINLHVFLSRILLIPVTFYPNIYGLLFNRFNFHFHLSNADAQNCIIFENVRIVKYNRFQFPT